MFGVHGAMDRVIEISEADLQASLKKFLESMSAVVSELPQSCGPFRVNELELMVQISASGGIELVGKADAGVSRGITIRLSRE